MASPSLLGLPVELRDRMYHYLCDDSLIAAEVQNASVTSPLRWAYLQTNDEPSADSTHEWTEMQMRGSSGAHLRLTCRQLRAELTEFMHRATPLKIMFSVNAHDQLENQYRRRVPQDLKLWTLLPKDHMNTVQYIQVGSRRFWDVALPVRNLQDHFPALKDLMVTGRPLMLVPKGPPSPGNHFARRDYMMKTVSHFSESAEMEKRFYLTDDRYDADAQRRIMAYLGDVVTSVEAFFGNRQSRSYGITLTLSILPWVSTCKELNGVTGCVRTALCKEQQDRWNMSHSLSEAFMQIMRHRRSHNLCGIALHAKGADAVVR